MKGPTVTAAFRGCGDISAGENPCVSPVLATPHGKLLVVASAATGIGKGRFGGDAASECSEPEVLDMAAGAANFAAPTMGEWYETERLRDRVSGIPCSSGVRNTSRTSSRAEDNRGAKGDRGAEDDRGVVEFCELFGRLEC